MCLAVPGKILDITEQNKLRLARVQFGGIVRRVSLDFVPEATVGYYVVVHVGFAISRIDEPEAVAPMKCSPSWSLPGLRCSRTARFLQEMAA